MSEGVRQIVPSLPAPRVPQFRRTRSVSDGVKATPRRSRSGFATRQKRGSLQRRTECVLRLTHLPPRTRKAVRGSRPRRRQRPTPPATPEAGAVPPPRLPRSARWPASTGAKAWEWAAPPGWSPWLGMPEGGEAVVLAERRGPRGRRCPGFSAHVVTIARCGTWTSARGSRSRTNNTYFFYRDGRPRGAGRAERGDDPEAEAGAAEGHGPDRRHRHHRREPRRTSTSCQARSSTRSTRSRPSG